MTSLGQTFLNFVKGLIMALIVLFAAPVGVEAETSLVDCSDHRMV